MQAEDASLPREQRGRRPRRGRVWTLPTTAPERRHDCGSCSASPGQAWDSAGPRARQSHQRGSPSPGRCVSGRAPTPLNCNLCLWAHNQTETESSSREPSVSVARCPDPARGAWVINTKLCPGSAGSPETRGSFFNPALIRGTGSSIRHSVERAGSLRH